MNLLGLKASCASINNYSVPGNQLLHSVKRIICAWVNVMRTVAIGASLPHWDHWEDGASLAGTERSEGSEPLHGIVVGLCSPLRDTRLDLGSPGSALYGVECSGSHAGLQ